MVIAILSKKSYGLKQLLQLLRRSTVKLCKFAFITVFAVSCFQTYAHAADVTLQWNANTESDLAGYKIYYGNFSGAPYDGADAAQGISPILVALASLDDPAKPQYTVTGLDENEVYYFAVTAYDTESLESDYSNEVSTDGDGGVRGGEGLVIGASSGGGGCFIDSSLILIPVP